MDLESHEHDRAAATAAADTPAERASYLETILDRLPTGVVVVDAALHVEYANAAARRLLGDDGVVTPGSPLPDPWPHPSLRDLAATLFTDRPAVGERVVATETGAIAIVGVPAQGSTAMLRLEDVTESERARHVERTFIENAAHELRTPLAAIAGAVDVLEGGAKSDPEALDRFLVHLRHQSGRLTRLTQTLLTLARLQSEEEKPRLELVPARPLLEDVAAMLEPAPHVSVTVDAEDDVAILADADLVRQALLNVAQNAVAHTREGEIVLEARDGGRMAELTVRDTGAGMDPVQQQHAFDRFYRGERGGRSGFGLGLAIADDVASVLGGTIALRSRPNAGTTVTMCIPSARLLAT